MNRIRKITSAMMVAAVIGAAAVPASYASAETVTVEQQMYAGTTNISKMKIAAVPDQAYTGKAIRPSVVVKSGKTTLKAGTDYTLTYKNNKKVGTASVTIKGKGKYTGTKTITFRIVPGRSTISANTSGSKVSLSWDPVKGAGGYQVYYSVNGGSYKSLTSTSGTSCSSTRLKPGSNTLLFKVRAFKKVGGKTYYGAWSDETSAGKDSTSLYSFPVSGHAGTVKYLGFYDIRNDQKGYEQCNIFQSDFYGGKIEYISTYFTADAAIDKLTSLIASDDSPDLVDRSILRYPEIINKNMFESLDSYVDFNSDLWKGMKGAVDDYAWLGKHYYAPHMYTTSFALNYSKKTIKDNGLPDPYELYRNGKWTWDAWRDMMAKFCAKDIKNIGFYSTDSTIEAFILTTGTPLVDVRSNGKITNNISNPNVKRAMQYLENLCRDGLSYDYQLGDWVPPQTFATECDRILFLAMEPEWTYTAATETVQNHIGVENDIFDTVSDFAFVPFPRDPQADAYYQGYDTFGYLIPKGAKNAGGAAEFINLNRAYQLDPDVQAKVNKEHVDPEKTFYDHGKYAGNQKWVMIWGEQEYALWKEMSDPSNFVFVNDDVNGLGSDLQSAVASAVMDVVDNGASWAQKSAELAPVVDSAISKYAR